jgi:hypothetical protein
VTVVTSGTASDPLIRPLHLGSPCILFISLFQDLAANYLSGSHVLLQILAQGGMMSDSSKW